MNRQRQACAKLWASRSARAVWDGALPRCFCAWRLAGRSRDDETAALRSELIAAAAQAASSSPVPAKRICAERCGSRRRHDGLGRVTAWRLASPHILVLLSVIGVCLTEFHRRFTRPLSMIVPQRDKPGETGFVALRMDYRPKGLIRASC